jgi:hypothetical protein
MTGTCHVQVELARPCMPRNAHRFLARRPHLKKRSRYPESKVPGFRLPRHTLPRTHLLALGRGCSLQSRR